MPDSAVLQNGVPVSREMRGASASLLRRLTLLASLHHVHVEIGRTTQSQIALARMTVGRSASREFWNGWEITGHVARLVPNCRSELHVTVSCCVCCDICNRGASKASRAPQRCNSPLRKGVVNCPYYNHKQDSVRTVLYAPPGYIHHATTIAKHCKQDSSDQEAQH